MHRYSEAQLSFLKEKMGHQLYYFGYSNHPSEENHTAFFDFGNDHKPENLAQYYKFREHNETFIKQLAADGGWKGPKYENNERDTFEMYPGECLTKV